MASQGLPLQCAACGKETLSNFRTNFYGLRKAVCSECAAVTTLPMRNGYRVGFYVVALWMGIGLTIRLIRGGNLLLPAIILAMAIAALVQDRRGGGPSLGFKRWIQELHGGQLAMILLLLATVGFVLAWIGNTLFLEPSRNSFKFADDVQLGNASLGIAPDTAAATTIRTQGNAQAETGTLWVVGALFVWLIAIPALWWWFGGRRPKRPPKDQEIQPERLA